MRTLYLFRRDLRIYDNRALFQAYKDSEKFLLFIFLTKITLNTEK